MLRRRGGISLTKLLFDMTYVLCTDGNGITGSDDSDSKLIIARGFSDSDDQGFSIIEMSLSFISSTALCFGFALKRSLSFRFPFLNSVGHITTSLAPICLEWN